MESVQSLILKITPYQSAVQTVSSLNGDKKRTENRPFFVGLFAAELFYIPLFLEGNVFINRRNQKAEGYDIRA